MSQLDPIPYPDAQIRRVLERVRTIVMIGASSNWNRPSYFVMKYRTRPAYSLASVLAQFCWRFKRSRFRSLPVHSAASRTVW
jgi:hypothetical protein